jgi:hypothetical protein
MCILLVWFVLEAEAVAAEPGVQVAEAVADWDGKMTYQLFRVRITQL